MTATPDPCSSLTATSGTRRPSLKEVASDYLIAWGVASTAGFQATIIIAAAVYASSPAELVLAALFHWIVYLPLLPLWLVGVALIGGPTWAVLRWIGLGGWVTPTFFGAGFVAAIHVYAANAAHWSNTLYADEEVLAGVAGGLAGCISGLSGWLAMKMRAKTRKRHVTAH